MSLRRDNFRLAYRSLKAAKARSFLTMLGIVIGVMAGALVICIGQGVKQQIAGQITRYGKSVFIVRPGPPQVNTGVFASFSGGNSTLLTDKDVQKVQKTHGVKDVAPLTTVSGSMTGDHTVNAPFIIATTPEFADIIRQPMQSGGFFSDSDNGRAVVLGFSIAQKLFNDNEPLGQALLWHGQRLMVAGVFSDFVAPPFSLEANFNNAVFVSSDMAQRATGSVLGVYEILAKADSTADTARVANGVNTTLVSAHGGAQDVNVALATQSTGQSDQTIHLITLLVAGAAIIALVVGGVGIMDVMLVSVTERMYEIGLRKAIGATNRQIMRQFIAEAFVLSGIGALIGVVLSAAAVGLLRAYTSLQAVIVWEALVIAPVLAIAIGLFFGSMPAFKAARKDPIEALRHD